MSAASDWRVHSRASWIAVGAAVATAGALAFTPPAVRLWAALGALVASNVYMFLAHALKAADEAEQ